MGLKERLRRARGDGPKAAAEKETSASSKQPAGSKKAEVTPKKLAATVKSDPGDSKSSPSKKPAREPGQDWLSKGIRALVAAVTEVLKLGREMLVIPAQLWLYVAEIAGAIVLRIWRSVLAPVLRTAWRLLRTTFALAQRHVTPARAVAIVAIAAAVGLAASQWLDYRSVTVGNDAYAGGVEAVAPAPDVARDRAGDAHSWVMIPLAVAAIVAVVVAFAGRPRAARLLLLIGAAAIVVAIVVDAPKGLDEGTAALAYEGAEAQLLEGFWAQIAAGGVLIACGLILPAYLRPARADAKGKARAGTLLTRAKGRLRMPARPKATPKPSPPKGSSA